MLSRRLSRTVPFCGAAAMFALAIHQARAVDLATNGSFENPTDTASSESFSIDTWTKVGPSIRRSIFHAPMPDGRWNAWLRTFDPSGEVNEPVAGISAGTSYTFNAMSYFEANFNATTSTVYALVDWRNASNVSVGTMGFTTAFNQAYTADNWTPNTVTGNAPAGTTQAVLKVGWQDGGASGPQLSVFFDKIELLGIGSSTEFTWVKNGSGDWNDGSNWGGGGIVPNGVGSFATFGGIIDAPHTVYSDAAVIVGTINFDNNNTYVVAGAGSLTLQATGSNSAFVNVVKGSHKINLPLIVASNATLSVASGATLKVSDPVTVNAGKTIFQTGSGAVLYESTVDVLTGGGFQARSSSHMARLSLASGATGTLLLGGNASAQQIDSVSLNSTATLDLVDNDLVTGTGRSTIEGLVKNARNSGSWNQPGITSTAAKNNASHNTNLGILSGAEYSSFGGGTGVFAGRNYSAGDTLVKYTWNGDTNFSGTVNFDDYVRVDVGFNTHLTGWGNGDFDYSGAVNFDDYVLIDVAFNTQNGTLGRAVDYLSGDDRSGAGLDNAGVQKVIEHFGEFGLPYASSFLAAVPEPATAGIAGVIAAAMAARPRRRRHSGLVAS